MGYLIDAVCIRPIAEADRSKRIIAWVCSDKIGRWMFANHSFNRLDNKPTFVGVWTPEGNYYVEDRITHFLDVKLPALPMGEQELPDDLLGFVGGGYGPCTDVVGLDEGFMK